MFQIQDNTKIRDYKLFVVGLEKVQIIFLWKNIYFEIFEIILLNNYILSMSLKNSYKILNDIDRFDWSKVEYNHHN